MEIEKKGARVYIGCSLTHAPDAFKNEIKQLKDILRAKYDIMEFHGLEGGTEHDVYKHDIAQVRSCDLMLAECSRPATGLGFEIATALAAHKPVLAVAKTNAAVSRLILGIDSTLISFIRYERLDEVVDAVEKKLAGII